MLLQMGLLLIWIKKCGGGGVKKKTKKNNDNNDNQETRTSSSLQMLGPEEDTLPPAPSPPPAHHSHRAEAGNAPPSPHWSFFLPKVPSPGGKQAAWCGVGQGDRRTESHGHGSECCQKRTMWPYQVTWPVSIFVAHLQQKATGPPNV